VIISAQMTEDAARVIARRVYGQDGPDDQDRAVARLVLLDIAPAVAGAERRRIASHIDPRKLELIAAWFELEHRASRGAAPWKPWTVPDASPGPEDAGSPERQHEVSRELRQWAALLRGGEPGPETVAEMLAGASEAIEAVPAQ
jgi:hypothetical protein